MNGHFAKRTVDLAGSLTALILTSPFVLAAAVAVRVTMGSPVLFRQKRPGKDGKPFELVKFRTMRHALPHENGPEYDGARLTRLGQLLRSTSIDELPTLLNVVKGDMSLVGPRPLLMRYLPRYSAEQRRRHNVSPGITGWAQVNGRNQLSWGEKFRLDVWYVDNQSFWLDVKILAMTVLKVVRRQDISQGGHATMPEFMGSESDDE